MHEKKPNEEKKIVEKTHSFNAETHKSQDEKKTHYVDPDSYHVRRIWAALCVC